MNKYIVEYTENLTQRPLTDLDNFILIGPYEAESPKEAALKVEAVTGRENMAFRVTELLPDGQKGKVHLLDFM